MFRPVDDGPTIVLVRNSGDVFALAPDPTMKRAICLVRNQMVSLVNGDL